VRRATNICIYVQDLMGSSDVWEPEIVSFGSPMSRHF